MTRETQPKLREIMLDEPAMALLDRERALITLRDTSFRLRLTIPMCASDALALERALEARLPLWPFAIDLLARTLEVLGIRLDRVVVQQLADELTLGTLDLVHERETYALKARAADALLLGLRMRTPLFAAEELLDPAALR